MDFIKHARIQRTGGGVGGTDGPKSWDAILIPDNEVNYIYTF